MYRIQFSGEEQPAEFGGAPNEVARQQTIEALARLSGLSNSKLSKQSHQEHVEFIEDIVFDAMRDIYHQQEATSYVLENSTEAHARALKVAQYVGGLTYAEMAASNHDTDTSARETIDDTLTALAKSRVYGKSYFAKRYTETYPNPEASVIQDDKLLAVVRADHENNSPRRPAAREDALPQAVEVMVGDDSLGPYLQRLRRTPLLTAEQEVELAQRIEAGLVAEHTLLAHHDKLSDLEREELDWLAKDGAAAFEHFYVANLRLVVSIAKKFRQRDGMPHADLIQEGNFGLQHAIKKFDYKKGNKFSTYASNWIKQAITRSIAVQADMIRKPVHVNENIHKLWKVERSLEQEGLDPTPELLAERLKVDVDRAVDLLSWRRAHVSLDTPIGGSSSKRFGNESTLLDLISDSAAPETEEQAQQNLLVADVLETMQLLDSRTARIILSRFGIQNGTALTLAEVGMQLGISAERVRQLEREGLQQLRRIHNTADAG